METSRETSLKRFSKWDGVPVSVEVAAHEEKGRLGAMERKKCQIPESVPWLLMKFCESSGHV